MPLKCCAPGCTANYDKSDGYVSVFKFPDDPVRQQLWLKRIPRANLTITKNTVICRQHFEDRFVISEDKIVGADGHEIVVKRERPKLTDDAYPSVFANIPSYLSSTVPPRRKNPSDRYKDLERRDEQSLANWITSDELNKFADLRDKFQERLLDYLSDWTCKVFDEYVCFYIINFDNVPNVTSCVKILSSLFVTVYVNGYREHDNKLTWLLGTECKLKRWSELQNLLSHYKSIRNFETEDVTLTRTIRLACDMLNEQVVKLDISAVDDEEVYNDDDDDASVNVSCVKFCIEQLQLACSSPYSRRYSNDMLQFAFTLFVRSSSCYRILLESNMIILPQPRNLQKLSAVVNFSPGIQVTDHEQMRYLKLKADGLSQREKFVVLQVDEMHVTQGYNYKGGRITGVAENTKNEQANAVQAFLISSIAGSLREIVALVPVKQNTSSGLTDMIKRVITVVQACGFIVVTVASDNNQMNAKAFADLCGSGDISDGIPNPEFPQYKIFFIFDTVHILKCIRNNWLNQKDSGQTFVYPQPCPVFKPADTELTESDGLTVTSPSTSLNVSQLSTSSPATVTKPVIEPSHSSHQMITVLMPALINNLPIQIPMLVPLQAMHNIEQLQLLQAGVNNTSNVCLPPSHQPSSGRASVSKLKAQYEHEKNSLLKEAPGLRYKTLYPTNLERQKVSLVLGIFNEKTVEALASKSDHESKETAAFINVILSWWKIMNVKSLYKGSRLRDVLCQPFRDPNDLRMKFLDEFIDWLQHWGESTEKEKTGCLTKPTFRALMQTTRAMCNIIRYCHLTLGFEYFLTGKVQTDNLERRFGLYRQLCGANYHVSVVQVLEAEKKLRVSSLFALRSAKHGIVNIRNVFDDHSACTEDEASDACILLVEGFENVVSESLDIKFNCDEHTLVYVAGYVAFKCASKTACPECKAVLLSEKQLTADTVDMEVDVSYIDQLSRGGLKYPSYSVVICGYRVYCTVQVLLTAKYEDSFLKHSNQRRLVCALAKESLECVELSTDEICGCSRSRRSLFAACVRVYTNIFLNNYTKISQTTGPNRKRKLKAISGKEA